MYAPAAASASATPFSLPTASSPAFSSLGSSSFTCGGHSLQLLHSHNRIAFPGTKTIPRLPFPTIEAKAVTRRDNRIARHQRIRKKVEGTPDRPRMSVFRSNKHIYVQVIDDTKMHTLASASTMQKPVSEEYDYSSGPTIKVAKMVGEVIAKSCLEKGIMKVAFDRGGYPYHGRIEALASAARENGLQF